MYGTIRTLWSRKLLIAGFLLGALVLASLALVLIGPTYTGEATIQLNFVREEPASGAKSLPTASVDATTLVDSLVRVIRSHPAYMAGQTKLEQLRRGLIALREGAFDAAAAIRVTGQSFVPAEEVMTPSGPNILLVLGLTVVVALAVAIWLALQSR